MSTRRPMSQIQDELEAAATRFWGRVQKGDSCWLWAGERRPDGYGLFCLWTGGRRRRFYAHRVALLLSGRGFDDALVVRHRCDNPPCVNPDHLEQGTQANNIQDAIERGRLNTSGLAWGQASTWPPRPCRTCGVEVSEGRQRYCAPCKAQLGATTARQRQKMRNAS